MDRADPPPVPELSPLQYLALGILMRGALSGRELRDGVRAFGVRRTRAAFYQFMARLERDGLVSGRYQKGLSGARKVTERRYAITDAGRAAWSRARAFHRAVDGLADPDRAGLSDA